MFLNIIIFSSLLVFVPITIMQYIQDILLPKSTKTTKDYPSQVATDVCLIFFTKLKFTTLINKCTKRQFERTLQ
jgi:hypothetical protein